MSTKAKKRKNGEGTWGTKTVNGFDYKFFRKTYEGFQRPKYFYGKTTSEIYAKKKQFEEDLKRLSIEAMSGSTTLFYELCNQWLNKKNDIRETTRDGYKFIIDNSIRGYSLGLTKAAILTEQHFDTYLKEITLDYARSSIKKILYVVQAVCKTLVGTYLKENYAEKLTLPSEENVKKKKKEIKWLEYSDMEKLRVEATRKNIIGETCSGVIESSFYGINAYIIVFIAFTGLRIGEALALSWKCIDFENKLILVEYNVNRVTDKEHPNHYKWVTTQPKTKNGFRVVPLCLQALQILEDLYAKSKTKQGLIFLNKDGNIPHKSNVTRTLNTMQIRAGCKVKKCGLHALRHSFGSMLIENGENIKIVSEILGHSSTSFTYDVYIHLLQKQKMKAINLLGDITKKTSIKPISNTHEAIPIEDTELLKILQDNGYMLSELEPGVLCYIKDSKITKLTYVDYLDIEQHVVSGKDIYNCFYRDA